MKITEVTREKEQYICEIAAMEAEIFPDPWSITGIRETLDNPQARIWVTTDEEEHVLGYVICYYVMDEGEIARIAAAPAHRRQGVAKGLLGKMYEFSCQSGICRWLLDVRESNTSAIQFYEKSGFLRDGVRKNFYANPTENAILMSCEANKIIYIS